MKQALFIASVTAMVASSASAALVAAWDFQTTTNGGTSTLAAPNTPKVFVANFGSGSLFLDGTNGSSNFASTASNPELTAFSGTALNADVGIGMSTVTTSPACLAIAGGPATAGVFSANGKSMVFKFNMTSFGNLAISYATQRSGSGFTSQLWEYSTNGVTWTSVGNVNSIQSSFALGTGSVTNLSVASGLDNAATAYLRVTFTGATAATGNNRIDNVQFNADVIPAPGALALLGAAGLLGVRRRRA